MGILDGVLGTKPEAPILPQSQQVIDPATGLPFAQPASLPTASVSQGGVPPASDIVAPVEQSNGTTKAVRVALTDANVIEHITKKTSKSAVHYIAGKLLANDPGFSLQMLFDATKPLVSSSNSSQMSADGVNMEYFCRASGQYYPANLIVFSQGKPKGISILAASILNRCKSSLNALNTAFFKASRSGDQVQVNALGDKIEAIKEYMEVKANFTPEAMISSPYHPELNK